MIQDADEFDLGPIDLGGAFSSRVSIYGSYAGSFVRFDVDVTHVQHVLPEPTTGLLLPLAFLLLGRRRRR